MRIRVEKLLYWHENKMIMKKYLSFKTGINFFVQNKLYYFSHFILGVKFVEVYFCKSKYIKNIYI